MSLIYYIYGLYSQRFACFNRGEGGYGEGVRERGGPLREGTYNKQTEC